MSDDVAVRRARIEEIRPLADRYGAEDAAVDAPLPQGGVFWLAELPGEAIGHAAGTSRPTGCVVGPVWTVPGHRRTGVGRVLLEAIQTWATGTGVPVVELSVAVDSAGGAAFREALGHRPHRTPMSLTPVPDA